MMRGRERVRDPLDSPRALTSSLLTREVGVPRVRYPGFILSLNRRYFPPIPLHWRFGVANEARSACMVVICCSSLTLSRLSVIPKLPL